MEWLTFAAGVIIGALTIAAPIVTAWRQRVIQLRDLAAERQLARTGEQERREHEAKVARRAQWQPEYQAIRTHLDCGDTIAYRVLLNGPYTTSEFDALDVTTFRINSEILAARGVEHLRTQLLAIATLAEEMVGHALPDQTALAAASGQPLMPDGAQTRSLLRLAVLQDRGARDLAELIKATRQDLRTEWGD